MTDAKTFLFNKIEDRDDLTDEKLLGVLDVCSRQLTYLRSGQRNLTFHHMLKLCMLIDPAEYKSLMRELCPSLSTDNCIKNSFEYAAVTRDLELLEKLLDVHEKEKGTVGEYVRFYSFLFKYMKGEIKFYMLKDSLSEFKKSSAHTLRILVDIYDCLADLIEGDCLNVLEKSKNIGDNIRSLNERNYSLMKEFYAYRLSEILAHSHLQLNNLESARKYANILIHANINKRIESDSYYVLGMSHLLSDPDKCLMYLNKSYSIAKELGGIYESLGFFNLNFAKLLLNNKIEEGAHPSLTSLQKIMNGESMYNDEYDSLVSIKDPQFIDYAESYRSKEDRVNKFLDFVSNSKFFYAVIIVRDIIKAGEDSEFVMSLINLKNNREEKGDVLFEEDFIRSFRVGSDYQHRIIWR
ncbi:AimR family lysis-lysogeny pheromone receptor [Bacillus paralicheniformis]|uniref:Uncharacterized protein n=1 Tax=Bacillus paralicheniformis TaxID=1648923 RepID=A0ABY3FYG5_9BACI|nr:AimR family lysis-lysogeny pheromone receptor [Bacillus paralicheniformis]TWL40897.1 hypothetical protein CHCC15381_0438 [Bacillus paralicheniformis]WEZ24181.1 AimR family lysis-lysogeny pheromone receptor [Bacillus paralicheniformis]